MEIKDVIYLVLGSNFIIALATFFTTYLTTKMQIKNSDNRFKIELGRDIDVEKRKRKWEIRSEPLFELRNELAIMAVKLDNLVADAQRTHTNLLGGTKEEIDNQLKKSIDEWNSYRENGGIAKILFLQCDKELVNRVQEITKTYQEAYFTNVYFKDSNAEDMKKAFNIYEINKTKIIEVQELINKKLEEV